jgi:hypothetical protein
MRTCVSIVALLVLTSACSQDVFDPGKDDAGGNPNPVGGEGGKDGGAADTGIAPGTDAVWVSSSLGTATGDGTQTHPLASLDAAIAKAGKLPVNACAETYAEQVHFANGVNVFGYYDCKANWVKTTSHAKIAPKASPAAFATNITATTTVEAVDIVAPDFVDQSQSSIALFATSSPALTIKNATIHAGTGGKGSNGANAVPLANSGTMNGDDAWAAGKCTGGMCSFQIHTGSPAGGTNACGNPGGAGGDSGYFQSQFNANTQKYYWAVLNSEDATAGLPTVATSQTNQGGAFASAGQNGAAGANGKDGLTGNSFGNIVNGAYVPSDGTAGTDGAAGQGGGGAGAMQLSSIYAAAAYAGYYGWGEPGAGGGAGGCAGLAGGIGKGGGASIAIVAIDAGLTLDTMTIESSKGGDGGAAGTSSASTSGGLAGKPGQYVPSAGNGGAGGKGGVSGNGGGGPSLGIAYNKAKPTLLACTVTPAAGGQTLPASDDGMSAEAYQFGQ